MLAARLWTRARKRAPHRQRRERKAHFGELLQLDGTFHLWYEARGPRGCLMNLVNDATARTLARLGAEETIWAAADVLRRWIEAYGVPLALCTDWENVYVRVPNAEQQATGGRAPDAVWPHVRVVGDSDHRRKLAAGQGPDRAPSRDASGSSREQLRRLGIADAPAANALLASTYLPEHNDRFAQPRQRRLRAFIGGPRVVPRSIVRSSSRTRVCCPTTG